MSKERCYKIDNLKTLLIILVVVGHFTAQYIEEFDFYKSIFMFIYAFHMPLFIFISGMFYNPQKAKANSLYYLLMGFALRYFIQLCRMIFCPGVYKFIFFEEGFIPWFVFALSAYHILMLGLSKVNKNVLFAISVIVACIAGYFPKISDLLCSSRIIVFFPYFIIGTMVNLNQVLEWSKKPVNKAVSAIIIAIWGGLSFFALYKVYFFRGLFTGRNPYISNPMFHTYGAAYRLAMYLICILTSAAVLCLVPNIRIPVWTECGKRTLQVFLFHYTIQLIAVKIGLGDYLVATKLGKILWVLLAVAVTFMLFLKPWTIPVKAFDKLVYSKVLRKSNRE